MPVAVIINNMIITSSEATASPWWCRAGSLSLRSLCVGTAGCRCVHCRTAMFGVWFLGVLGSAGPWTHHKLCPPIPAGGIPGVRPGGPPWPGTAVGGHQMWGIAAAPSEGGLRQSFGLWGRDDVTTDSNGCFPWGEQLGAPGETYLCMWMLITIKVISCMSLPPSQPLLSAASPLPCHCRSGWACRQQLKGCSRNLLAQSALINPVGLCNVSQEVAWWPLSWKSNKRAKQWEAFKLDTGREDAWMKLQGLEVHYSADSHVVH